LRLTPLDQDIDAGRKYLNERSLQIGHVLPPGEDLFKEYFPVGTSFLLYSRLAVDALFSYRSGREKRAPIASFTLATDSLTGLKESIERVEDTAIAQEKLILQTRVFGYDRKRLQALKALNYRIGVTIPGAVSLDGKRFDLYYLYKELEGRYRFSVRRTYAKQGLYPVLDVEKAKNQRLQVRGYRKEDRNSLDRLVAHHNVIRGIGSGVFEGSQPFQSRLFEEWFEQRRMFPIVCEDESIGEPVGTLDLQRFTPDVMQHVTYLGMYVRADYQGLGVGTMLMEAAKVLARRLHGSRVILSVFEGNTPAEKLYRKAGFVECGKIPGWLQEGYVNEIYMVLNLD
jgi:RimJ/RimL family protein N-acetyltransferase